MNASTLPKDLLEFVACPLTHQAVRLAEAELLESLNQRIATRQCKNVGGKAVSEPLFEALVTADNQRLYPVRDGIPVMLVDESIVL